MDAIHTPVLSRWAAGPSPSAGAGLPEGLACVDGLAGSPAEALARARAAHPGRDVLLMREGVALEASAWARLAAAWREGDWDVLSPLDGRWPLAGDGDGDALAWTFGPHAAFAWDGWSDECSLWRGDGHENPDGPSTGRRGLLPCVQVGRAAPTQAAPPLPVRRLLARAAGGGKRLQPSLPTLLHVLHAWGGGIERFARDLAFADASRNHLFLVARGDDDRPPFGRRLCLHADLDDAPLQTWPLAAPVADCQPHSPEVQAILSGLRAQWGLGAVLVSSLVGHSLDVLRTGLPTALCAHDLFPAWPLLHDARDPARDGFDEAALATGIREAGKAFVFPHRDPAHWRTLREALEHAVVHHDVRLVAPSAFARDRARAFSPALAARDWQVVEHGFRPFPAAQEPAAGADAARPALRVLVPGRVHGAKGNDLLGPLVDQLPAGVELVLLGTGPLGQRYVGRRGVHLKKDYARDELPRWVAALRPDLALLPSTVPETWSYALSEMWALGLPVLCADLGAPAARLRDTGAGWCLPPTAEAFARQLQVLAEDRAALAAAAARVPRRQPGPDAMAAAWREALPAFPATLALPPAGTDAVAAMALDEARGSLAARLAREEDELAQARAELDRRADWALDLQAQLARSESHRQALAAEHAAGKADAQARLAEMAAAADADRQALEGPRQRAGELEARLADLAAAADADRQALEGARQRAGELEAQVASLQAAQALLSDQHAEARALVERQREAISALQEKANATRRALEDEADAHLVRIATLEQQLAEAHGYYQRDCTDLARQRDVALAQRDEALRTLDQFRRGWAWRLARKPQRLIDGLRGAAASLGFRWRQTRGLAARGLASLRVRGFAGTLERWRQRRAVPTQPVAKPAPLSATGASGTALRMPQPANPRASIIVPVYNQLHMTLACLRALADAGDAAGFEVIVVDDGSSDGTPQLLPTVPGLVFHRNARNLGFIGACNAGAARARGEFLVFLNNDTTVQPGWLDALLRTFETHADTGLAGSKLVYPDGRLQEAGGIVFADGSCWNYGRFEDPAHPRFNFVREVDYCSGAAIAIRRALFDQLGGFDAHYAPAYYEDTDLAMRVRQAGLKVRYQPASVVVHHEGATSGTDTGSGVKAYQVANQAKFRERWGEVLAREHCAPSAGAAAASERGRRCRVLLLDACTPTPDRDSGSLRMAALLRLLREEGCAVSFFPENRAHDGAYTEALQQLGIEAWWHPWISDVPRWLAEHGRGFDLVIASRHYVLAPVLPLLRQHAPRARIVFDTVDLHYLREQREAELADDDAGLRKAARTRKAELALITQADLTWVVSQAERELLATEAPGARVEVVSNIHDLAPPGPGYEAREGLLFVGGFRHPPNVDAARWLADEILPRIHARAPGLVLHLVGGEAPPAVQALGERPGIRFHGYVPDLGPLLDGARISVAPLRYGAGVKGKVNQALAHGLPVVATHCAVEGMHLRDGEDVLVADDADAFAAAVLRLHADPALWRTLSEGGRENTRRHFSPEVVREPLRRLIEESARR